jgi:O-methyltransferase
VPHAPSLIDHTILARLAELAASTPTGAFVEVGVYKGGSAAVLLRVAKAQGRTLYLFDTFTGIPYADPDKGDTHKVGDFGDTSLDAVGRACPGAILCPGVFPQTLPPDIGPVAFAHIDCDQYASIRGAAEALSPRMVPGGVMVFDDYGHLAGATRAVQDWLLAPQQRMLVASLTPGPAKVTF